MGAGPSKRSRPDTVVINPSLSISTSTPSGAPKPFGRLMMELVTAALAVPGTEVNAFFMPKELVLLIVTYVPPPELIDWNPYTLWSESLRAPNEVYCSKCKTAFVLRIPTADAGAPAASSAAAAEAAATTAFAVAHAGTATAANAASHIRAPPAAAYVPTAEEKAAAATAAATAPAGSSPAIPDFDDPYNRKARDHDLRSIPEPKRMNTVRVTSSELYPCTNAPKCEGLFTAAAVPSARRLLLWSSMIQCDRRIEFGDPYQRASRSQLSPRAREAVLKIWNVASQHAILLNPSLDRVRHTTELQACTPHRIVFFAYR